MLNLDRTRQLLSRLPIQNREGGEMVPFTYRFNQWLLNEKVKQHQLKIGGKIRVVVPKARRVGVSSLVDGWGIAHIAERENATAWIVACLAETAEELFRVPTDLVNNWPWPLPKPLATKITYPHKGGDSYLTIATAKSVTSGRGPTLSFLHLSEAAYYPSGASFMSLLPSISDDPGTIIAIESTCNGKTGQGETFWKFWDAAIRGDSEYLGVFLTWLDDPICRRMPIGIKFSQCNEDEKLIIQLVGCSDKCERCRKCWKALSCIAWRRWAIHNLAQGKVEDFQREYPVTAEEAFYSTSYPAFTLAEKAKARATVREPIAIGRLEIDTDSYGQTGTGQPRFVADDKSHLLIWARPTPDYHYYFGADAARGQGGDYTAVSGFCGQTGEQVCRYANRHTDPESLARLLFLLGTWYNYGMVNIELTGNLGLWAQKVLRDTWKYRNIYRWRGRDDKTPGPRPFGSLGWETNQRTRDMMLSAFRSAIAHDKIKIRDSALLTQMDAAEMEAGRWQVPEEIHDDIMVSAFISWIALAQWHTGYKGGETKQLLGDMVATDSSQASQEVMSAKGDVDAQVQAHWRKLLVKIKLGGQTLTLVDKGKGVGPIDRLQGI